MFLNTGLHLLLNASFLNHPEGSHDCLCGRSEQGEQSQFMEEIRCGERLSSEIGSRADSGAVVLTCFPVQRTPIFTVQGWSGPGWLPDRNIPGQQWAFWKPCVLTPVHCFSVFVPSIITTVSLDTISNPIHFTVFFPSLATSLIIIMYYQNEYTQGSAEGQINKKLGHFFKRKQNGRKKKAKSGKSRCGKLILPIPPYHSHSGKLLSTDSRRHSWLEVCQGNSF